MDKKRRYIRVPPELFDGDCYSVSEPDADAVASVAMMLQAWWDDGPEVGDRITLVVVELTDAEFESIPEI